MVSDYDQSSFVCFGSWHMWKILAYMENTVVVFLLVLNGTTHTSWIIPKLKENCNRKHQNVHDVKCLQFLAEADPAPSNGTFRVLDPLLWCKWSKDVILYFCRDGNRALENIPKYPALPFKIGVAFA